MTWWPTSYDPWQRERGRPRRCDRHRGFGVGGGVLALQPKGRVPNTKE